MKILAAADFISGKADTESVVTCTIYGMELNGTTQVYKVLYQGQLISSISTLYTTPTSTIAFIKSIDVVNTDLTTAHTFVLYRGGTVASNTITPIFNLPAGGSASYEDGTGWGITTIAAGTTFLNDIHTGYSEFNAIANPSVPSVGRLRIFARNLSGRMIPKWMPPSGLDSPVQPAFFGNNIILFTPYGSTTVTPNGFGTTWAKGGSAGTVSTLTPASTAPAIINQMKRLRHANAITTTNQCMGIISTASGMPQFWRGNSAGCGGFFMFVRFNIGLWASNTNRLFVGFAPGTAEVVASNTPPANCVGLWHDDTMGTGVLYFMTKDATTQHNGDVIPSVTLAAGQGYDFYMFAKPNDSTIYYRLDDINAGTILIDSSETNNLPLAATFLGPQVEMSNGATNITANTVAIDINRIYIESDH